MRSQARILLVICLLFQLLAGQQVALAHMIGHLGESLHDHPAQIHAAAGDGDEERGPAHALSHVCTTCVGCAGTDCVVAADFRLPPPFVARNPVVAAAVPPAPTFERAPAFLSRAPPMLPN